MWISTFKRFFAEGCREKPPHRTKGPTDVWARDGIVSRRSYDQCLDPNPSLSRPFLWGKPSRRSNDFKFGYQSMKTRLPFRNLWVLYHKQRSNYIEVDNACCNAHPPPHLRHQNSIDRTMNVEVRHLIFLNKKFSYLLSPNMLRLLFGHAWRDEGKE